MTESVNEAAIENVAAYASSPFRISRNQWKAAEAPEPLSNAANLVLQALRGTGQYMGIYAIIQTVGTGTPGEIRRALKELEDRGLLEEQPKEPREPKPETPAQEPQEPAQEPSAPEAAPAPTEPQPTPQEPAESEFDKDYTGAPGATYREQIAASMQDPILIEDTPAMPPYFEEGAIIEKAEDAWELRLGEGPNTGIYPSLEEAVAKGQEYILAGVYGVDDYRAQVRHLPDGPWIAVRDPRAPSVNESAAASR